MMETERNRKDYQETGAIEAFECKNKRSDFIAITEKK